MKTCARCGAAIFLIQTGDKTWKWVTDEKKPSSWHCGNDPEFPVRSHAPATM